LIFDVIKITSRPKAIVSKLGTFQLKIRLHVAREKQQNKIAGYWIGIFQVVDIIVQLICVLNFVRNLKIDTFLSLPSMLIAELVWESIIFGWLICF
jgi:hypothetical protein